MPGRPGPRPKYLSVPDLMRRWSCGRSAVQHIIEEMEEDAYLERVLIRGDEKIPFHCVDRWERLHQVGKYSRIPSRAKSGMTIREWVKALPSDDTILKAREEDRRRRAEEKGRSTRPAGPSEPEATSADSEPPK